MSQETPHPLHLEPSELGTKEYWDEYYQNDLENGAVHSEDEDEVNDQNAGAGGGGDDDDNNNNEKTGIQQPAPDPSELDSWFDDVGAPAKTLAFLTSTTFPLSPNYVAPGGSRDGSRRGGLSPVKALEAPWVLDLGTGNGSALFALRLHGHYAGRMVGVDYSSKSVELARKLRAQYAPPQPPPPPSSSASATDSPRHSSTDDIAFEVFDIIHDSPQSQPWWPSLDSDDSGFDLVLDKGTFDAISLSSATVPDPASNRQRRACEVYPAKVLDMVKPGGYLLVTSCNWTEAEVVAWFTRPEGRQRSVHADGDGPISENRDNENAMFEVYDMIKYPVFEFGGQKGQGVASVCFRKLQRGETDQG